MITMSVLRGLGWASFLNTAFCDGLVAWDFWIACGSSVGTACVSQMLSLCLYKNVLQLAKRRPSCGQAVLGAELFTNRSSM